MCKLCENLDECQWIGEEFVDIGVLGSVSIGLSTYRSDENSPMLITSDLFGLLPNDGSVTVELSANYCPVCGRKLV